MVTNINLVTPESEKKPLLTGKASLALSVGLVILMLGVYGALSYLKWKYSSEKQDTETQIQDEKNKMSGPNYAAVSDFQERLDVLSKVVDDHSYWDAFLKSFSKYILPEVRLTSVSWDEKKNAMEVKGIAPNFEVLSREIILLQKFSGAGSVEFKNAGEKAAGENSQGGISFELDVKIEKNILNGKSS